MSSSAIGSFAIGISAIGTANQVQIPAGSKRVWGRTYDQLGNATWVQVSGDQSTGTIDNVYLTALAQVIQLNLGESPFYANYGIPAQQSIITQVFPDYYAMQIQAQYSSFFAALTIARVPQTNPPTYDVQAVTHNGTILGASIAR